MTVSDPETAIREELDVPSGTPTEQIDVRELGPPGPLKETLETLTEIGDDVVLVQLNDRTPQHLYPKLDDRGYEYGTIEREGVTITAIWHP